MVWMSSVDGVGMAETSYAVISVIMPSAKAASRRTWGERNSQTLLMQVRELMFKDGWLDKKK